MGLTKVTYQDLVTVIAALNLNDIQDAIIALEGMLPSIAPEYSVNTSYTPGDYVVYQNVLYKCTSATSGAWNPSKWTACNFGDEMQAYEESTDAELRSLFADLVESITTEYSATAMYDVGDIVEKDGLIYKCIVPIITPEAWTASHWTAIDLSNEIAEAQRDATEGYSDTLTAGDLTSDEYAEDTEPYLFRRTYGGANNHAMDVLTGGTVAWNQLVQKMVAPTNPAGITYTLSEDEHSLTVNGTSTNATTNHPILVSKNIDWDATHKYFITFNNKSVASVNVRVNSGIPFIFADSTSSLTYGDGIGSPQYSANAGFALRFPANTGYTFDNYKITLQIFDLTQMFGSTIADAVYAMEQATAGSGVAWFRKYFPESYYAYDAGTLKSVEAVAHRMVGFNQWDGKTESGYIYNGTAYPSSNYWRSKNYVSVIPNQTYCVFVGSHDMQISAYDYTQTYVMAITGTWATQTTYIINIPSNVHYIKFYQPVAVDKDACCINISDPSRNGQYEPYKGRTYKLSPLTLRGIPKLTDGKLQYDGDTYEPSGQVVRKYGVVDLGTLTWTKNSSYQNLCSCAPQGMKNASSTERKEGIVCSQYAISSVVAINDSMDDKSCLHSGATIVVKDTSLAEKTASEIKTAMSGVYLVYELATPTTETASPYESTQVVYADGTEEYISQNIVPVGHNTRYPVSIKQALTQIAKAPSANGTYILKCTVSGGVATYSWVTE